ncbi:MAG: YqeG family HAD IIIA-type phosphatase [Clostridia bacterium]|nr:YqeG family HAD IIIA-type phosphatase [Clostridia bacterium]
MNLYPKIYLNNVQEITYEMLEQNKIQGIILDVDNTLIDYYKNIPEGTKEWCTKLKEKGFKFCIASNSNKKEKVKMVAQKLDIPYIYFAKKPLKIGLKKARDIMGLESKNVAVVGDQIFTDVLGANRTGMFSILVEPIKEKDIFVTVVKRPIENYIKKKYKERLKDTKGE